jgi:hypothetical protein
VHLVQIMKIFPIQELSSVCDASCLAQAARGESKPERVTRCAEVRKVRMSVTTDLSIVLLPHSLLVCVSAEGRCSAAGPHRSSTPILILKHTCV